MEEGIPDPKTQKLVLTDDEWRDKLSIEEYLILRKKCTEKKHKGEYNKFEPKSGYFACRGCSNPLYSWKAKFDANCGWPSFDSCFKHSVYTKIDYKHVNIKKYTKEISNDTTNNSSLLRLEILCLKCDGHLGHIFPHKISYKINANRTNQRDCVNSKSIKYINNNIPIDLIETMLDLTSLYKTHRNRQKCQII